MKKILPAVGITLLWMACASNHSENQFSTASAYDDSIITYISQMQQSLFGLRDAQFDSAHAEGTIKRFENRIDSVNRKIKKLPAYDGDNTYRDAAYGLGEFYKKSVSRYYADIAKTYHNKKDSTADAKVQEILEKMSKDESAADNQFLKGRESFAKKFKLNLQSGE